MCQSTSAVDAFRLSGAPYERQRDLLDFPLWRKQKTLDLQLIITDYEHTKQQQNIGDTISG